MFHRLTPAEPSPSIALRIPHKQKRCGVHRAYPVDLEEITTASKTSVSSPVGVRRIGRYAIAAIAYGYRRPSNEWDRSYPLTFLVTAYQPLTLLALNEP